MFPKLLSQICIGYFFNAVPVQFYFTGTNGPNLFQYDNAFVYKGRSTKVAVEELKCPNINPNEHLYNKLEHLSGPDFTNSLVTE